MHKKELFVDVLIDIKEIIIYVHKEVSRWKNPFMKEL
jgi:hypothetical protein